MTTIINASPSNGLQQTADGSGILKVQSNGVTTNALAWLNYDGSTQTINKSYNISSVTRNSVGDWTLNFVNAMSDSNYIVVGCTPNSDNSVQFQVKAGAYTSAPTLMSTTQVRVISVTAYSTAGYYDAKTLMVAIFGN